MDIPIKNIYYLLCYAWNKLDEKELIDIQGIERTNLFNLFAKVLIEGTSRLLKSGLDRGYISCSEETGNLKGKIDLGVSIKRNLLKKAKAKCDYDELSYNILHNQILKTTLRRLSKVDALDEALAERLCEIIHRLSEIDEIELNVSVFRKVQLHRNNSFYDFLMKVCELVVSNLLPSEKKGHSKFRDFIRDEDKMANIFEEFVRNFYRIEQKEYSVGREDIYWDITASDAESMSFIPKMQTDVSLEGANHKIILDTKYYKNALNEYYDAEKIKSENISQMYAYLTNLDKTKEINQNCSGILLYPTLSRQLDINVSIKGHPLSFKTINLNQEWQDIHRDMLKIVGL